MAKSIHNCTFIIIHACKTVCPKQHPLLLTLELIHYIRTQRALLTVYASFPGSIGDMFVYVITAPINKVFYCCVKSRDNNHCGSKGAVGSPWSEISHHNSLQHTLMAIALYLFFTSSVFLGDTIPTGSKNECELRKKKICTLLWFFTCWEFNGR